MRKVLVVCLCLICTANLYGCSRGQTYDGETRSTDAEGKYSPALDAIFASDGVDISVTLSPEDSKILIDILTSGDWEDDLSNCGSDIALICENGDRILYHSECGTFNNIEGSRSLHVSGEQQNRINSLLSNYGPNGADAFGEALQIKATGAEVNGSIAFSQIGIKLYAPAGAENCKYFITFGKIAQIDFSADGVAYVLRGSNADDIAGVCSAFEAAESFVILDHKNGSCNIRIHYTVEGGALADWKLGNTYYTLFTQSAVDRDSFEKTASKCGESLLINSSESDILIQVTAGKEHIYPYPHFANSGTWTGNGFLCADGTPIQWKLPELTAAGDIPCVHYADDFTVTYAENVAFKYILLYNDRFESLENLYNVGDLAALDPGTYNVGIIVSKSGDYIEEAKQCEYMGWCCVFQLTVE